MIKHAYFTTAYYELWSNYIALIGLLDVDWCPGDGIVAMGDVVALLHHLGLPLTQDIPCTNLVGVTPLFRKYGTYLTQHKSSQVIHAFLAGTPSTSGWVGLPFLLCRRFSACLCKLAFSEADFRRPDKVHSKRYPFISVFLYPSPLFSWGWHPSGESLTKS